MNMRDSLDRFLDDITLLTLAFAVALGWSLYQVAHGVALLIDGLLIHVSPGDSGTYLAGGGTGASWVVDNRVLSFDNLIVGLIELITVLAALALVQRLRNSN